MSFAVADARREVRERADFVTEAVGGHGAVREVCDALLDSQAIREQVLEEYLQTSFQQGSVQGRQ